GLDVLVQLAAIVGQLTPVLTGVTVVPLELPPILANVLLVPSHFLIFSKIATVLLKIPAVVAPVADILAELALVAAGFRAILPDLVGASGLDVLVELLSVSRELSPVLADVTV